MSDSDLEIKVDAGISRQVSDARTDVDRLKADSARARSGAVSHEKRAADLESQLAKVEKEIAALSEEKSMSADGVGKTVEVLETRRKAIEAETIEEKKRGAQMMEDLAALNKESAVNQRKLLQAKQDKDLADAACNKDLISEIEKIQKMKKETDEEVQKLRIVAAANADSEKQTILAEIGAVNHEVQQLQTIRDTEATDFVAQIHRIHKDIGKCREAVNAAPSLDENEAQAIMVETLKDLENAKSEYAKSEADYQQAQTEAKRFQADAKGMNNDIGVSQRKMIELQVKKRAAEQKIESFTVDLKKKQEAYAAKMKAK